MASIMIVDDAEFMRNMLKRLVIKMGHEVTCEAANGEEAVQNFEQYRPELITMDITMPDMDGISAMKKILEIDPKAKVIMCSAMGQHSLMLEAITSGAKDFIIKPFQEANVMESIENVLNR